MEYLIETFSSLWKTKFPGSELPDTTFFNSKQTVEFEIQNRVEKINELKLELAKEEFLLIYLKQAHENQGLWEVIDKDNLHVSEVDNVKINDDDAPKGNNNKGTVSTSEVFVSDLDLGGQDEDIYDVPRGSSVYFTDRSRLINSKKKAISLDTGSTRMTSQSADAASHAALSGKKSLSLDTEQKYFSCGSSDTSSSDDDHEYMNADEYYRKELPKPLPKAPLEKGVNVDDDFVRAQVRQTRSGAELYENFHMKPTIEKLKISSVSDDEDVKKSDDINIYSVPVGASNKKTVKRSGSRDRQGSTFSDDLDVNTYNATLLSPSAVEKVLNTSEESSVDGDDENVSSKPVVTGRNSNEYFDDAHIYATVTDIRVAKPSDDDDSDNESSHKSEDPSTHYREMTHAEIAKLNVSDEDDIVEYDSDDGSGSTVSTPDSQRKNTNSLSGDLPRSRSGDCLSKVSSDEKCKTNVDTNDEKQQVLARRNRKYLVMNLLDTEKCYIDCLGMLSKFMKPLRVSSQSTHPILSAADFDTIFHSADQLLSIHKEFMCKLEPLVQDWNEKKLIGEPFKLIMYNFDLYSSYIGNHKNAMETVLKCRNANVQFRDIMDKDIRIPSLKDPLKLDALLFKPIDRMTQYSVLLNDLLKYTPPDHLDHPIIVEISGELFKLFEQINVDSSKKKRQQRTFLKETAVVEIVDGERRARNLILFNDVLISAKMKSSGDKRDICKWYASLADLSLKRYPNSEDNPEVPTCRDECDKIRASLANLRQEYRKEQPLAQLLVGDAASPFTKRSGNRPGVRASSRAIEKLKKKIEEQERLLQLLTPITPFHVYSITGKTYTLLVGTEEDRFAWVEALKPRIKKAKVRADGPVQLSSLELQQAFETVTKMQNLSSRFGSTKNKDEKMLQPVVSAGRPISMDLASLDDYKELLFGFLFVNIHNAKGFHKNSDTYIMLETSCYGHFYKKGKSKQARGADPQWEEDFNIEVEACQYLRLTCFNKLRLIGDDISGKVCIDLTREKLSDNKLHKINVSLDKGVITMNISLCFSTTSEGLKRSAVAEKEGVFGVPIKIVSKREKCVIPAVVIGCIKEVEKRGMDEVGIYRLSGVASEIRDLKKLFNEDTQMAVLALAEMDIHAVSGLLKLYFRDLPDSLFTGKLHHKFVNGLNITDPEEKELYMADTLHELPKVNLMTALYLFHHLRRVVLQEDCNKMGLNNLATVFGPTVLRAPASTDARDSCNVGSFDIGALDVMSQVGVFRYLLSLTNNKRTYLPEDDLELWRRLDVDKAAQIEMGATQEFLI